MPPRTNLFQDVVALVERHKAPDALITESDMLIDSQTGQEREVDVTVTSAADGDDVVMSIEAADRARRADVTWVEQLYAKHLALPTTQLVLVAAAGFSAPALSKAAALRIVTIAPVDLVDDDHEFAVIGRSMEPVVTIEPTLAGIVLDVRPPVGTEMVGEPQQAPIYFADGSPADVRMVADTILGRRLQRIVRRVSQDLDRIGRRVMTVYDRPPEPIFGHAKRIDTGEIERVSIEAVTIEVNVDVALHSEMTMVARLFDNVPTLHGRTTIGAAEAIFVATDHQGARRATLRTREPGQRAPDDWTLDETFEIRIQGA
jgi:hypothetical protein